MSLALALNNALSGLKVNQRSLSVLSQNIANVNTAGYSRQVLSQSAVNIEGLGSGVRIDDVTRKIDKYLQRSVQTQGSNNATAQTINAYYERLQALLGQPGTGNTLDAAVTRFFNSVQQLAETPETTSLKSNAISSGVTLAKQLSDLAANIHDLRFEADRSIADATVEVNGALDRLYSINNALTQAKSLGQSTAGLLDERDKALREVSEFVNIMVSYGESGNVTVVGGDGVVLLEEGVRHHLRYVKAQSANTFVQEAALNALEVTTLNDAGVEVGVPVPLITNGTSATVDARLSGGSIAALQVMRDTKFPALLDQLDQLASRLRDGVNAVHNKGSGFPPATVLSGDRLVRSSDQYSWEGAVRIAVLRTDGTPVPSSYSDETYTGVRPLTIDLGSLNSGQGNGKPTVQTLIDEINNHFGAPGNRVKLGNINNIQLASDTNLIPSGATSLFNFDLDLENISEDTASVFVTGVTVLDDTATNITSLTQPAPSINLLATNSYITTAASADVTINLSAPSGLAVGDTIYLDPPSGPVNGIAAASLTGFFTVTAVSGNSVTFTAGAAATSSGPVSDPGPITMMPPYQRVAAGQQTRTKDSGELQVDLTASLSSAYYDITVNVTVVGADGVVNTAPVTYRVTNNQQEVYNKRYNATAAGAPATLVLPNSSQASMRAIMVDANGNELPKLNGKYVSGQGYLKLVGGSSGETYAVAIDELDSRQLGAPDASPAIAGTNRGFSHFFGLNNFFESNDPIATGDTLKGSAYNLKVQDRFIANATLLSTGTITKQQKSNQSGNMEIYTYARYSGDNSIAQLMALQGSQIMQFDAAGGLPTTQLSIQSYTSDVLGFIAQRSAEASNNAANSKVLFDGFQSKSDAVSGVNLDEELANTIIFQNAYSATARVLTTVNKMYEDLLQSI